MKKAGRVHKGKSGAPSRSKLMLIGAATACVLTIAVIAASMNSGTFQQEFSPSSSVPAASGSNANLATADNSATDSTDGFSDRLDIVPSDSSVSSDEGDMAVSPVQVHFTDDNFELLTSNPDGFVNSTADISGRVYELVDQSSSGYFLITYRIYHQAIDSEESRAVAMLQQVRRSSSNAPDVSIDDCISIQGKVRGGIRDSNSLGQPIQIPIIDLSSMKEIECIDSAMPALRTISANLSQSYAGVILTAERVQMLDGHLRIKIAAQNIDGGDSVFIRDKESVAEYQGKSYPSLNLSVFETYKIDNVVPAKSEISGYLFFEPIMEFAGEPIVFRIVVEKAGIAESEKSTFILKI